MTDLNNPFQSYAPQLLLHISGLSISISSANTGYAVGSAITIPKNGVLKISLIAHVNINDGFFYLSLTRNGTTYYFGGTANSLFGNGGYTYIGATSPAPANIEIPLLSTTNITASSPFVLEITVMQNDTIQFYTSNNGSGDINYIDDLEVLLY